MSAKSLLHSVSCVAAVASLVSCSDPVRNKEPRKNTLLLAKVEVVDSKGNKNPESFGPGEKYRMMVELVNTGRQNISADKFKLSTDNPSVQIQRGESELPALAPRERAFVRPPYEFTVSKQTPGSQINMQLDSPKLPKSGAGFPLSGLPYPQSGQDSVQVVKVIIQDSLPGGNGDGKLNPGETVDMFLTLKNVGNTFIDSSRARISTDEDSVEIILNNAGYLPFAPDSISTSLPPGYKFRVLPGFSGGPIQFDLAGINRDYSATFFVTPLDTFLVCLEEFKIVRATCTSKPDSLIIRLSLCNEKPTALQDVALKVAAEKIRVCGENISRCTSTNTMTCPECNEEVYFASIASYECLQPTRSCAGRALHAVFRYLISPGNRLPAGYTCFSFDVDVFVDIDPASCTISDQDVLHVTQRIGYSVALEPPAAVLCPPKDIDDK